MKTQNNIAVRKENETKKIVLIDREKMSGLSTMLVEGECRNLGIVKNFRDHEELKNNLPVDLSISWAHLDPDETLDTHRHPVASLIIAIEGSGSSKGDSELTFNAGDSLIIPPWNEHGFTGLRNGLWALSIQFNEVAIFENEIDPLTTFEYGRARLPELAEREITIVSREDTTIPFSFRTDEKLDHILPDDVDFRWLKVSNSRSLSAPATNAKRLVTVCSGRGFLTSPIELELKPGHSFWQNNDLSFSAGDSSFWLLLLEIQQRGVHS